MNRDEYYKFWELNTDEDMQPLPHLTEDVKFLMQHILALWQRLDKLPDWENPEPNKYSIQCACAYDYPNAVCMVHEKDVIK